MAWYGNHIDSTRKLDELIDQKPTLAQLFQYPQFLQQTKSYNPKLLDYLANTQSLIRELIDYITIPPVEKDSEIRKFKLPAFSIQLIESDIACIINWFFRPCKQTGKLYVHKLFTQLMKEENHVQGQILPLLSGYFLRTNICLLNSKYKQTIDFIYQFPECLQMILKNCESYSIINVLQIYLNLDLTKTPETSVQNRKLKLRILNQIMSTINKCLTPTKGAVDSSLIQYLSTIKVQNLSTILIEIFQKYYLMTDGKEMVDQLLLKQDNVNIFFKQILNKENQISLSMLNILNAAIKFYSFSSYNSEEPMKTELNRKNQEKLDQQPLMIKFVEIFPQLVIQLSKCQRITIYHSKIIQVIMSAFTLNSINVFNCVKKFKFVETVMELMFRFQMCSILGNMIQKLFLIIFRTEKGINDEYKKYIFLDAKIIDLTADRYLEMLGSTEEIQKSMGTTYRRKGYFGQLMKLMKIYSGVQTTNTQIIHAIQQKSVIWNQVSKMVLKPYQMTSFKQLGSYENIPQANPIEYSVKSIIGSNDNVPAQKQIDNSKLIEQINRQQSIQNLKQLEESSTNNQKIEMQNNLSSGLANITPGSIANQQQLDNSVKSSDDQFFNTPGVGNTQLRSPRGSYENSRQPKLVERESIQSSQSQTFSDEISSRKTMSENQNNIDNPRMKKQAASYSDFLEKEKVKAETQIKKQRSRSKERQLSKGKARMTSPSPSKRVNKWSDNGDQTTSNQTKQKISLTGNNIEKKSVQSKNLPKIPNHKRGLNVSSKGKEKQEPLNKSMDAQPVKEEFELSTKFSKSMVDMQELKKVKIIYQFDPPAKKQYRQIDEQDKAIFDMLGIVYQ